MPVSVATQTHQFQNPKYTLNKYIFGRTYVLLGVHIVRLCPGPGSGATSRPEFNGLYVVVRLAGERVYLLPQVPKGLIIHKTEHLNSKRSSRDSRHSTPGSKCFPTPSAVRPEHYSVWKLFIYYRAAPHSSR